MTDNKTSPVVGTSRSKPITDDNVEWWKTHASMPW
jgi:hypothetical protein